MSEPKTHHSPEIAPPSQWCIRLGVEILDPDGWRPGNPIGPREYGESITEDEFRQRFAFCTARILDPSRYRDAGKAECFACDLPNARRCTKANEGYDCPAGGASS